MNKSSLSEDMKRTLKAAFGWGLTSLFIVAVSNHKSVISVVATVGMDRVGVIVFFLAIGLWFFRKYLRPWYGITEFFIGTYGLLFGLSRIYTGQVQAGSDVQVLLGLAGFAYIIVRGLDNIDEGQKQFGTQGIFLIRRKK